MTKESRLRWNLWVLHKLCKCLCDTVCDALCNVCLRCLFYLFISSLIFFLPFFHRFVQNLFGYFCIASILFPFIIFRSFCFKLIFLQDNQPKKFCLKKSQHRFILRDAIIMIASLDIFPLSLGFASDFCYEIDWLARSFFHKASLNFWLLR